MGWKDIHIHCLCQCIIVIIFIFNRNCRNGVVKSEGLNLDWRGLNILSSLKSNKVYNIHMSENIWGSW